MSLTAAHPHAGGIGNVGSNGGLIDGGPAAGADVLFGAKKKEVIGIVSPSVF